MPGRPQYVFEADTVKAAAQLPGIVGLKDSSANMMYFRLLQSVMADRPDFSLLMGPETLLAETVLLGGHGGVCGGANVLPKLYVDLYEAALAKDLQRVEVLHKKVVQINATVYRVGRYASSFLKGLKCALSCLDICSDFVAEPFHRFREPEREIVRRYVEELGITRDGLHDLK
jgi:4-hydroxy-tetrahydrodipicolinate synthase